MANLLRPRPSRAYGQDLGLPDDGRSTSKLFVFASHDRQPRLFEFEDTPDGLEALANLARSEDVFGAVRGHRISYEVTSVVRVAVAGTSWENQMLINKG